MAFQKEPSFQHGQAAKTAVLYCNLGTPSAPTAPALRKYLAEFLGDSRVVEIPKPIWWLIPGVISLALFAYLLTFIESAAAGRAYAAYGGVYIAASLIWLWIIEGVPPDRWDISGAVICLVGATIIIAGPR